MTLLIVGLIVFLGIHLVPVVTPLRAGLVGALGENRYKGVFGLLSLVGLVLIVVGFARAPYVHVYAPMPGAKHLAMTVMPFVFFLLAAANMPTLTRQKLKHPLLIAILLWAGVHLLANGDQRSILLFGGFAAYAVIDMISEIARGKTLIGDKPVSWKKDLMAAVGGLLVYAVVFGLHGWLFGVALIG